jgi:hypothetical protein
VVTPETVAEIPQHLTRHTKHLGLTVSVKNLIALALTGATSILATTPQAALKASLEHNIHTLAATASNPPVTMWAKGERQVPDPEAGVIPCLSNSF